MQCASAQVKHADHHVSNIDVAIPGYTEYKEYQAWQEFLNSQEWVEALEDSSKSSTDGWQSAGEDFDRQSRWGT